jgi:hypothetical protein
MSFPQFLLDLLNTFGKQIQLGLPAKIIKYDNAKMRADVKPYLNTVSEEGTVSPYPIIPDIPVNYLFAGGYYIRPDYQVGDFVWVTFSTFELGNQLNKMQTDESQSIFSLHNACVAGAIADENFQAPSEFNSESGLLIGEKTGNSYMVFSKTGMKMKFSAGVQEINFANGDVTANNTTNPISLANHSHAFTGMGKVGTPTTA